MFEENDVKCDMQTITFKGKGAHAERGGAEWKGAQGKWEWEECLNKR